jgi:hypothetical protein
LGVSRHHHRSRHRRHAIYSLKVYLDMR